MPAGTPKNGDYQSAILRFVFFGPAKSYLLEKTGARLQQILAFGFSIFGFVFCVWVLVSGCAYGVEGRGSGLT